MQCETRWADLLTVRDKNTMADKNLPVSVWVVRSCMYAGGIVWVSVCVVCMNAPCVCEAYKRVGLFFLSYNSGISCAGVD